MVTIFTDEQIIAHNAKRDTPCMTEDGECFIVTKFRIYQELPTIEVTDAQDVAVFATEREAVEYAARFFRGFADLCIKYTYTIRAYCVDSMWRMA